VRLVLGGAESAEEVVEYVAKRKLGFPVLHDPGSLNAKAWALGGIPYGLVLNSTGKVVWQGRIGPQEDAKGCEDAIRNELRRRASAGALIPR
jgi:hypothetical protein